MTTGKGETIYSINSTKHPSPEIGHRSKNKSPVHNSSRKREMEPALRDQLNEGDIIELATERLSNEKEGIKDFVIDHSSPQFLKKEDDFESSDNPIEFVEQRNSDRGVVISFKDQESKVLSENESVELPLPSFRVRKAALKHTTKAPKNKKQRS